MDRRIARIHDGPTSFLAFACSIALMAVTGCTSTSPAVAPEVPEGVTAWAPDGARTVGDHDYGIIPQPNAFHTMHAGPNNTDNVWVATAPRMELDWVSDTNFYIPEGPTFDNAGSMSRWCRSMPKPAN
ncbi:MAG: hypothetical protein JRG70_08340 [Deltaproteobacteria bacterium]|nr:hypothetical protein [Deltaproteobacteria bacterium]